MRSINTIRAARPNGPHSHSTKTGAAKCNFSSDTARYSQFSKYTRLQSESPDLFKALCQQFLDQPNPAGEVDLACIEEMIAATCLRRRIVAVATDLLDRAINQRTERAASQIPNEPTDEQPDTVREARPNSGLVPPVQKFNRPNEPSVVQPPVESAAYPPTDTPDSTLNLAVFPPSALFRLAASPPPRRLPLATSHNHQRPNEPRSAQLSIHSKGCPPRRIRSLLLHVRPLPGRRFHQAAVPQPDLLRRL
jgi:hypothetical protein